MRISLFLPCFNDALFPTAGVATVRVLERLGHGVEFPPDQTCCGQVHFNSGYRREAAGLLERFLRVFGTSEVVVAPSASCVAMVREQYPELAARSGNPALVEEVHALSARTFELSEFLVGVLGVEDLGAVFPQRVALHPTCHSRRSIDVGDAPLRLLRSVKGLELVRLPGEESCCGFGGTFAVKNPHTSLAMMEDRVRAMLESGAQVVTAVDNSCLMHLAGGMHRMGVLAEPARGSGHGAHREAAGPVGDPRVGPRGRLRVLHLAEILATMENAS